LPIKVAKNPQIRAIEIKLSQGAKPGKGGVLPDSKVVGEIAETRGVTEGTDCISPNSHSQFSNVEELIDFVELIAERTGLPVGIKAAIGETGFWEELAEKMKTRRQGGLHIDTKAQRLARFVQGFRKELLSLAHTAGYEHPSQFMPEDIELSTGVNKFTELGEIMGYSPDATEFISMQELKEV